MQFNFPTRDTWHKKTIQRPKKKRTDNVKTKLVMPCNIQLVEWTQQKLKLVSEKHHAVSLTELVEQSAQTQVGWSLTSHWHWMLCSAFPYCVPDNKHKQHKHVNAKEMVDINRNKKKNVVRLKFLS